MSRRADSNGHAADPSAPPARLERALGSSLMPATSPVAPLPGEAVSLPIALLFGPPVLSAPSVQEVAPAWGPQTTPRRATDRCDPRRRPEKGWFPCCASISSASGSAV